ncbi:MAG: TRAP transporter small permease [Pseudotabrizicola sp.]|uniref:TRAP transporter small permease n=1 Tax=Pseudotabrizicola sp. TaxID=2939647 RepID=UPI002724C459|nr:TRAP transporter small permease [Pseudotabrizicola sp.]MDO8884588.1 TRAP transporter small permease [Pseudotabrizicola sp.]MDP2083503.1 TRAP transporter small permease [Pseudotabrizicola sp.]MDZ7572888.1 TRAP transporter small permease [Pseudotabrizicola sp.]
MKTIDRWIWRLVDVVLLIAICGMIGLIALQVISRQLGSSVPWTEELSRFLFIWTIWFGVAASFRTGQHPAVTLFTDLVTQPAARRIIDLIPALAAAVLFVIVAYYGWQLLAQQIRFGESSPILRVGMWLATLPLVLGSGLAVLGAIIHGLQGGDYTHAMKERQK